ncbi:MAG: DUF3750 domain-containing protein [Pseudomonadota bacterium]
MRLALLILLALIILPIAASAVAHALRGQQPHWSTADRSPVGLAPSPSAHPGAVVQVYAARAYRWRGIFAVHTWIAIKEDGADGYTRFDVMGWGRPLRVNGYAPDARWFGRNPDLLIDLRGDEAARLIPQIRAAISAYPYGDHGGYTLWPGPNSNSFVAHVARAVPDLGVRLPPNAVGKDFAPSWLSVLPTPSNTGWQLSLAGYAGGAIGFAEGLELHVLGFTLGVDILRPALKLPGLGRIGLPAISARAGAI